MFDAASYGPIAFQRVLTERGVNLPSQTANTLGAIFDLTGIQSAINAGLQKTQERDRRKRAKIYKREIGRLARGLANFIATELDGAGSTLSKGIVIASAFEKWRRGRTFRAFARRYHPTPNGNCGDSIQAKL